MESPLPGTPQPIRVAVEEVTLEGDLTVPPDARGIILFAHGSGSSRFSPRNRFVAAELNRAGFATLLIDLLTPAEDEIDAVSRRLRFDTGLLAERLIGATDWLRAEPATADLPLGLFGGSTGAAAALIAAAQRPDAVTAVVSRSGRPDLAGDALSRVIAPVLLIVAGNDEPVLAVNEAALAHLTREKRLEVVPGATHLFAEPGTLEQVAALASRWFTRYLANASNPDPTAR
jgi:dienelactone hydrolase